MKVFFVYLISLLLITSLQADLNETNEINTTFQQTKEKSAVQRQITQRKQKRAEQLKEEAALINEKLIDIDQDLKKDIWYTKYNNHQIYIDIENDLKEIEDRMKKLDPEKDSDKLLELTRQDKALLNQLELLSDFKVPPFESLTKPQELESAPVIENPFNIFNGFTYLKTMKKKKESFNSDLQALKALIEKLTEKENYAKRLNRIYGGDYNVNRIEKLGYELDEIIATHDIAGNTYKLYSKKVDDNVLKATNDIKDQMKRLFNIAIIILVILVLSFLFKYLAKKTISDNERYYMANKGINFINFFLILFVLLFSFLENVSHIVTVLGFASAGLAFAMKIFL